MYVLYLIKNDIVCQCYYQAFHENVISFLVNERGFSVYFSHNSYKNYSITFNLCSAIYVSIIVTHQQSIINNSDIICTCDYRGASLTITTKEKTIIPLTIEYIEKKRPECQIHTGLFIFLLYFY